MRGEYLKRSTSAAVVRQSRCTTPRLGFWSLFVFKNRTKIRLGSNHVRRTPTNAGFRHTVCLSWVGLGWVHSRQGNTLLVLGLGWVWLDPLPTRQTHCCFCLVGLVWGATARFRFGWVTGWVTLPQAVVALTPALFHTP